MRCKHLLQYRAASSRHANDKEWPKERLIFFFKKTQILLLLIGLRTVIIVPPGLQHAPTVTFSMIVCVIGRRLSCHLWRRPTCGGSSSTDTRMSICAEGWIRGVELVQDRKASL